MLTAIRQWVVRTMMKAKGETGIVKTLPKKDIVEINTQITAERLMQNGIDPRSLKNPDQVENAIIAIENRPNVQQGIKDTESAKVFNIKGEELDPKQPIIGGTQEGKKIDTDFFIRNAERQIDDLPPGDPDLPPPGSRGGPDDIAAPVQSAEETMKNLIESELMKSENPFSDLVKTTKQKPKTIKEREKEILASMEKSNKETVARIKNRKIVKDAIDNASPGFVKGDRKYNAQLVADDLAEKKFGKEFSDLDQRQQMDLYGEALDGLDDLDKFADGGRIGFSKGSGLKSLFNFLNENNPVQAYKKYLQSVKTRAQENPKALVPELAAITSGGIFVNRRMQDILKNMKEKDMENNLENFREELNKDPFYQKYPDIKDKVLENYTEKMFGEKRADGGRIGFKDGMTRRTFLKLLGGAMSIPIIGKFLKPMKIGKTVTKVPIIKTDNVPGKPEWFDALVNKVIIEGDDVTKKFATKEREIVHAKEIDKDNYVTVTQDLDEGVVRVEYESPTTMFGDKVDMAYVKPLPDQGNPRPVGEFQTSESGIVGRAQGPDDYDLEIEGMSGGAIEDLESDVSKLKEYATGKKLTMKEIVEAKKRKDKVKYYETPEGQSEYVVQRQGEADDYYDDFASGGIARMLGE